MGIEIIIALFAVGLFVGFLCRIIRHWLVAMIMVPVLIYVFDMLNIPLEISGVMAIATSVGCIVFTGGIICTGSFQPW